MDKMSWILNQSIRTGMNVGYDREFNIIMCLAFLFCEVLVIFKRYHNVTRLCFTYFKIK